MGISSDCKVLLRRVADAGGSLAIFEADPSYNVEAMIEAERAKLVRQDGSGGWGTDDVLTLTRTGRELTGLPPKPSLLERIAAARFAGLHSLLPHTLKLRLRGVIYTIRHAALLVSGHRVVNPVCRNWESYPPHKMRGAIDFILEQAEISLPVDSLIDHGCWDGHYAEMLRPYTRSLIGLDILDVESVPGYDQYIRAPTDAGLNYLDPLADNSVDIVLIIASVGMSANGKDDGAPHCGDWQDYFSKTTERQGRYFTPGNYPRVLKAGGHIIVQEWEAYPEQRVGRLTADEVASRIDEFYPHSNVPGFSVVTKGISPYGIGPYIVFRKNSGQEREGFALDGVGARKI